MDNAYAIETRLASKNGWFTPDEARQYYGRYSRMGATIHWWNTPELAGSHDGTVDYILNGALNAVKSVNYVVSNDKITLVVGPDNVAWASQSGNPTTISIEFDPRLNDEGYKKAGWLIEQLEQRYGHDLQLFPHSYWFGTSCPGTLSIDRMRQEADKWARGEYNPKPTPAPSKPTIEYHSYDAPRRYVVTLENGCELWDFSGWDFPSRGHFEKGRVIDAVGYAVHSNGSTYIMTSYSYDANPRKTVGVNIWDVQQVVPVQPTPPVVIPPTPVPEIPAPSKPEWIEKLRDIDDTQYWVKENTYLVDITTGDPAKKADGGVALLATGQDFTGSALTYARGVEYRITEYSFRKGIFNGVPIGMLTLTPPLVPDIPPVQHYPDPEETKSFLQKLLQLITEFLAKFK